MGKKLTIADILEDKPKGLKLWSDTFGEMFLEKVRGKPGDPKKIELEYGDYEARFITLTSNGRIIYTHGQCQCIAQGTLMDIGTKVRPIELTGEMLEMNGFTKGSRPYITDHLRQTTYAKKMLSLSSLVLFDSRSVRKCDGFSTNIPCASHIHFVHQLQHLLLGLETITFFKI